MSEAVIDDIVATLPPLLDALDALAFFARHLHPPAFASVMNAIGAPDEALQAAYAATGDWPEQFAGLRAQLNRACDETLAAFAGIREVERGHGDLVAVFRALRHLPRALEALYPLAARDPIVNSFYLDASLRDARSFEAIVVAPTATGRTWALMGDDTDTPNLHRILDDVSARWQIDPTRLLLTGMSDGGTFCYVSGLEAGSRFTHLAPVSATFHPMMASMADAARLNELPIRITHGARDWMFPVEVARRAAEALAAAGADVGYGEIEDLSHCYPREINAALLAWLRDTSR
jgi:predicted esterase